MKETLGKFSEGIRKTIVALEKTEDGINYVKAFLDILASGNEELQPPRILTQAETQELLDQLENPISFAGYVLRTYFLIADECAEYANFLVENESCSKQEIVSGSLPYIELLYSKLAQLFKVLSKAKWNKDSYNAYITSFCFLSDLMCGEKDLSETYSFDFLTDVSELWEIIVGVTDQINSIEKFSSFSDYISFISYVLNQSTQMAIEFVQSDLPLKERRKKSKLYKKLVRECSKKLSTQLTFEAYIIRKNM